MKAFADRIKLENKIEEELAERLHQEAYAEAWKLGREMLKADSGLRKVILFGSALPGRDFRSDSDLDLAYSGGSRVHLEDVASRSSFHVDLLDLEDARPGIRESIEKEGVVIYAAPEN